LEDWVIVGRLGRTRGRHGELTAEVYSSQPGRAERLGEVKLQKAAVSRMARVECVWHHGGRPVFKFEGVDSISDAEIWEGADILVPEAERAKPEDGEFSHADLIGCAVWEDGKDQALGVVAAVLEYGSAPLLEVAVAGGGEVLVPLAREICREIDVGRKIIRAKLPDGLLEL
jgi:16S rRNA processing protein RimM